MKQQIKSVVVACMVIAGLRISAAEVSWTPTGAGTYSWTDEVNWGGALPTASDTAKFTAPEGNQTVTGDGIAKFIDVGIGADRARGFSGNLIAENFWLRSGRLDLMGRLDLQSSEAAVSIVGRGVTPPSNGQEMTLNIYGVLNAPSYQQLVVAQHSSYGQAANGCVRLREGGELILATQASSMGSSSLQLANAEWDSPYANASYVQDGGRAKIGRMIVGNQGGGRASFLVLGGILELPNVNSQSQRLRIGSKGYGLFQQLGGVVYEKTNVVSYALGDEFRNTSFELGSGKSVADGLLGSAFYACGGLFNGCEDFVIQGNPNGALSMAETAPAVATIDGESSTRCHRLVLGGNPTPGRAVLNLNGNGRLETDLVMSRTTDRMGVNELNGDGGTLSVNANAGDVENGQCIGVKNLTVYGRGLTLECNAPVSVGSAASAPCLRTAGGFGVESISCSLSTEFHYVPWVEISGGSGSNATAVALVDWETHRITNIVVTCRGEGYRADDQLTVRLTMPSTAGLSTAGQGKLTAVLSENKPGTLVKTGAKRLRLYGQGVYAGRYEVRAGLMLQSFAADRSGAVQYLTVGGTNEATFQAGSGRSDSATAENWNTVNPEAVLTLGTEHGPGCLAVPGGSDGVTPFEQHFAKLVVGGNGVTNRIRSADGDWIRPVKIVFGDIECGRDSLLVLPDPKVGNVKVYAPVSMAGRYLPNLRFDNENRKVGYVSATGEIIPKSNKGLAITLR